MQDTLRLMKKVKLDQELKWLFLYKRKQPSSRVLPNVGTNEFYVGEHPGQGE